VAIGSAQAGRYFVSVKCGTESSDFRLLPTLSKVELMGGERVSGTVCPGDLTLHRLDAGRLPSSRGKHLTWSLTMHSGDTDVMLAEEKPQLRLVSSPSPIRTGPRFSYVTHHLRPAYVNALVCGCVRLCCVSVCDFITEEMGKDGSKGEHAYGTRICVLCVCERVRVCV
jgi:hypothetical protein